ncbi:MAG: ParB/RepB/Spo0J family partition protein [Clostridia bacterium]|nr:ParB/RepB/Spo0J family partition protein [Clostridia bacterium]
MAKHTSALGRGLDALLPDLIETEEGVREIDLGIIDPNPDQPRRAFPEESIEQLAESIRQQGLLQPVLVTPAGSRYRLVAGERRWRAARKAGLQTIPCIVREMSLQEQMEAALIENLQREDLNPVETAMGLKALMDETGCTQEEAAKRVSMSRPAVANYLRLLNLPEPVQDLVRDGSLSAGHARVLAGLKSLKEQIALAEETVREGYSVRQLEAIANRKRTEKPVRKARTVLTPELKQLESNLRERIGVRATITGNTVRGRVTLQYSSQQELEAIWDAVERLGQT